mgnify:CR=1 FL=1
MYWFLALAAVGFAGAEPGGKPGSAKEGAILTVEVAENGMMFTPDTEYMDEDGIPLYGGSFITEGYIYPEGTLNETNGVNEDGSPEFPDEVIGRWICRGWHVGQGGHTTDAPWTVTTQIWDLEPDSPFGDVTIVTDGYETPIVGEVVFRAITYIWTGQGWLYLSTVEDLFSRFIVGWAIER